MKRKIIEFIVMVLIVYFVMVFLYLSFNPIKWEITGFLLAVTVVFTGFYNHFIQKSEAERVQDLNDL
jgi:uncharacterized membrane protein YqhA